MCIRDRYDTSAVQMDNPLLPIATKCIQDELAERPSADKLVSEIVKRVISFTCQQLSDKKEKLLAYPFRFKQAEKKQSAPTAMKRSADAIIDGNIVYLRQGQEKKIFAYYPAADYWKELPEHRNYRCSLALRNHCLLAIGGIPDLDDLLPPENNVYRLVQHSKWEMDEPMLVARTRTTALTCMVGNEAVLVVAGGETLRDGKVVSLRTVEIHDGKLWCFVSELPEEICCSSGSVIDNNIYLIGGWSKRNYEMLSVYTCKQQALMATCGQPDTSVWTKLATNCPVAQTTCTCLLYTSPSPRDATLSRMPSSA